MVTLIPEVAEVAHNMAKLFPKREVTRIWSREMIDLHFSGYHKLQARARVGNPGFWKVGKCEEQN